MVRPFRTGDLTEAECAQILMWADQRTIIYTTPDPTDEQLAEADVILTAGIERVIAERFIPRSDVAEENEV